MGSENLENFSEDQQKIIEEAFKKIMSTQNITKVNIILFNNIL